MIDRIITNLAKSKFSSRLKFNKFLSDIPNSFFLDYYSVKRVNVNSAIIILSLIFSIIAFCITLFYDIFLSFLILIIIFLATTLFFIRRIRKTYLSSILEVEQYSDLICREMLLVFSSTHSLSNVIEYLSKGSYPIISKMLNQMMKNLNIGSSPEILLEKFAKTQPSETVREFIIEILLPMALGNLSTEKSIFLETQWRLRKDFDSYLSQLEGKMSIFLAITTIIPITISMLLVMLGHVNLSLLIFLPLIFFVFDLIAVEIFNSGRTKLLGG